MSEARQVWDTEAASFDDQPDHGLRDSITLAAWTTLLKQSLPSNRADLLDVGCGTGSLSLICAGLGCKVTGIDVSPQMIALAKAKAAASNLSIQFHVMDAAFPQFPPQQFDVLVCRHVLWALPEPQSVLQRWTRLLKPTGRLLLIEGFWHTGAGLHSEQILQALPALHTHARVQNLSDQPELWGGEVKDERYIVVVDLLP